MPRIDPLQLLTCLKVLLDKNGGILSFNEVKRLAGLMTKYSKKLVSKCIYIQILKCTKTELLGEFMGSGGWQLVNLWLTDGLRAMNYPLVTEILELFLLCPVDVERLKSNTSPKLVKTLSREGPPDVRILATRLVEQWLNIVKASNIAATAQIKKDDIDNKDEKLELKKEIKDHNDNPIKEEEIQEISKSVSPKRKISTESASSLTLKIVVKDGKQVVSKVDEVKEEKEEKPLLKEQNDIKEMTQTELDEDIKDKEVKNKQNEEVVKKESKESKEKNKHTEKEKVKDKSKDKDSRKDDKDRHKSSKSSKSSKSHSSSSSSSKSSSADSKSHKTKHSSSSNSSSSSKSRDKEKEEKDHKNKSHKSSKDKHRHEKEKSSSKEKEKDIQIDMEKILNKESLEKLGKIPKKPRESTESSNAKPPTSITIPSKKASISIEIRKDSEKTKTVKTYKSQFRSHGLTEEAPPPPSRKQIKKPNNIPLSIPSGGILGSASFASSLKRSSPTDVNVTNAPPSTSPTHTVTTNSSNIITPPADKKPKIDMTTVPSNMAEKPGSIKLIAPKPKPALIESDMFMDALSASTYKKNSGTKRKRRPSNSTNAESPTATKTEPLKFYQDTLEVKDEEKKNENKEKAESEEKENSQNEDKDEDDDDDNIPLKKVKEDIEQKSQAETNNDIGTLIDEKMKETEESPNSPEESPKEPVKKPPGPGCGPDGPPGVLMLNRRTGPKKKLKWKAQEELEEIRYFELDENERVNVTKAFNDMKSMERMHERESFILARKSLFNEDLMTEQTHWRPLIEIDDVPPHPEGLKSEEKKIQAERERHTLKALYFSRAMIPDSASEPDMEQYLILEPKIIPLDDITGNNSDTVNDFVEYGYPDPKGSPPADHEHDDGFNLNINNIPGHEVPMNNQNNQFNPFLPFGGQPVGNQNNWAGPNMPNNPALISPNNINNVLPNMNPLNMIRPHLNLPINNSFNGPPPLMATLPMGPINNGILPFGPNGSPNNMMNGPPQNLLANIFGPNGCPPQRMNLNNAINSQMHNQMNSNHRNNANNGPGGGNWRSAGPGSNWRSNTNDRGNNRNHDRSSNNWAHGNNRNREVCKQFLRGFCRNGSKCNYAHTGNSKRI